MCAFAAVCLLNQSSVCIIEGSVSTVILNLNPTSIRLNIQRERDSEKGQ